MSKLFEIIEKINAMKTEDDYFEISNTIFEAYKVGLLAWPEARGLDDVAMKIRMLNRHIESLNDKMDKINEILKH